MKNLKVKFLGIIGLMMFLCLFSCWGESRDPSHKKILVLHSHNLVYSSYLDITQSFTRQMCNPEYTCEYEHFEIKVRIWNDQFTTRFKPYLEDIKAGKYDAIVCIGDTAYWNISLFIDEIPENIPLLYIVADYVETQKKHLHYSNNFTYHPVETAQLALSVFPDRKNIAFLSTTEWENTDQGKDFTQQIGSIPDVNLQFFSPAVFPEKNLSTFPEEELLEKLSEDPKSTIAIIYDWPNQSDSLQDYMLGMVNLAQKIDALNIPVFVLRDYLLVDNVVGGVVTYVGYVGKDAAEWLKEYFKNGKDDHTHQALDDYRRILNWNVLKRYGVPSSRVPYGVVVANKPYSFWEHNRFNITMIVGIIFVVLSLLLAAALNRILLKNSILKVTAEKARQAETAKGRFLSNMSHEIRTPLSVIISLSDLLQFKNTSEQEKEENLTTIHYASESLLKLINNILDFSKLEEGKMKIKEEEILIREMLNEIDKIFQVKASEKKIGFHCEYANVPARIWLDEVHLKGIIVNLLGNSMKFTTEGKVELDAAFRKENEKTGTLTVKVRDTGIGMSPEFLKDLFKPFNQEGRSNAVGTGLGLTISRRMAQSMGGDLTVESEMGKGSTFTLEIPGVKYSEEAPVKEPALGEQFGEEKLSDCKVLVVDDMQMNLMVVTKVMKNFGIKPLLADTPEKALNLLKENEVDIILTDLRMPEMNGDQLAREMRKLPNGQKAKIYVLTADVYAKEEIDTTGVDDVLVKPLSMEKIKELLKSYSSKKVA